MNITGCDECLVICDVMIIYKLQRAYFKRQDIGLTPTEYAMLCFLAAHRGTALSREQISIGVWGSVERVGQVVGVINRMRKRFDPEQRYIRTVRLGGYKMVEQ